MLTSPVPAARAAVATGAWVESKNDMYLIHSIVEVSVGAQASFVPIRRRLKKEKREKRSLQMYLVPGAVHASTQQTTSKCTYQRYGRLSCA